MKTQGWDPPKAAVSRGVMGIAYKVGLGVMVTGVIFLMSREILGVIASMFGASEAGAVLSGAGTAVMVLGLVSYLFEGETIESVKTGLPLHRALRKCVPER